MISVLLADDHDLFLRGVCSFLEGAGDIHIVTTAANGEEAIAQAILHLPDVAVIDISMPVLDGIEVTRQISQYCPSTRVLIYSIFDHSHYVQRALEAGATGYILKDRSGDELLDAIRAVAQGEQFFSGKTEPIDRPFTY